MKRLRHVWLGGEVVGLVVLSRACLRCGEYRDTGVLGSWRASLPCLLTDWPLDKGGYGFKWLMGATRRAHRWAWEQRHGPIPAGMGVLHHCDEPACIQTLPRLPSGAHDPRQHLFLGTNDDNVADMVAKGRARGAIGDSNGHRRHPERWPDVRGEAVNGAKLTEADIPVISARLGRGEAQRAIAGDYGVCQRTIALVGWGKTWSHIQ